MNIDVIANSAVSDRGMGGSGADNRGIGDGDLGDDDLGDDDLGDDTADSDTDDDVGSGKRRFVLYCASVNTHKISCRFERQRPTLDPHLPCKVDLRLLERLL
jgi:hypothetical protein